MAVVVAHDQRAIRDEVTKVSDCRNRRDGDVPGKRTWAVLTVVTGPEGGKPSPRFSEHLESRLPTANHSISPSGKRRSEFFAPPNG